jgi:hypothetical protein
MKIYLGNVDTYVEENAQVKKNDTVWLGGIYNLPRKFFCEISVTATKARQATSDFGQTTAANICVVF